MKLGTPLTLKYISPGFSDISGRGMMVPVGSIVLVGAIVGVGVAGIVGGTAVAVLVGGTEAVFVGATVAVLAGGTVAVFIGAVLVGDAVASPEPQPDIKIVTMMRVIAKTA
jgi:hypothetical protein